MSRKTRTKSSAEWWTDLAPEAKTFLRDLMSLVEIIGRDEVLELRRQAHSFVPVLRHRARRPRLALPEPATPKPRPDGWWAALSPADKDTLRQLARIVWQSREGDALEFRRSGGRLDLTVHIAVKSKGPGTVGGRPDWN